MTHDRFLQLVCAGLVALFLLFQWLVPPDKSPPPRPLHGDPGMTLSE